MYYNTRNNSITNLPLNGYFEDGTLVQGLDLADFTTQKLCGYLPIKNDTPQPENATEDETQRVVVVEEDGVNITRVWVTNPPVVASVPASISPRQIRLWFINNNIPLATVENAINGIEDVVLRETTKVEWEYSPYVERNHPMINNLGAILGLTPEQIDQAFITASVL
jgi:hypothetical protein